MTERSGARQRGYGTAWEKARAGHLRNHPFCGRCEAVGVVTMATVVNHRTPHRGDKKLFWDKKNWESVCEQHHNSAAQREDNRGYSGAVGADGWPTDPRHPGMKG